MVVVVVELLDIRTLGAECHTYGHICLKALLVFVMN